MTITLCHSKTDPLDLVSPLYIGVIDDSLCPVIVVLAYLSIDLAGTGPLFVHHPDIGSLKCASQPGCTAGSIYGTQLLYQCGNLCYTCRYARLLNSNSWTLAITCIQVTSAHQLTLLHLFPA